MAIFARIVECGSISAAAADLALSKSVVSQQLTSLEQALGISLLNRTTRKQVLTPAGRDFYQRCVQINSIAEQAWDEARETQQLALGSVTISAPHALIESVIAPAVADLVIRHDKIQPVILANDQRVDLIEEGIDLAIRVGEMPSSSYRQRLLGRFSELLCASPQYIQRHQVSSASLIGDPEYCAGCDYIANAWQGRQIHHRCRHKNTAQEVELSFAASRFSNSLSAVLAMVEAGLGLAFVPDFIVNNTRKKLNVDNVMPDYEFPPVPVYAVHAFGAKPPLLVKLCMDAIKQTLSNLR